MLDLIDEQTQTILPVEMLLESKLQQHSTYLIFLITIPLLIITKCKLLRKFLK